MKGLGLVALLAVAAGAVTFIRLGQVATLGLGLGLAASAATVGGSWFIVRVLAGRSDGSAGLKTLLAAVVFLLKIPIFLGLATFAHLLGWPALPCFLIGVALVYSSVVAWVFWSTRRDRLNS